MKIVTIERKEPEVKERTKHNECYVCIYKRDVPGSCHSMCTKPDPLMEGAEQGIENGWFYYPTNFDPVWKMRLCENFKEKG